ncbi:Hypothetical protein Y17_0079 [Pectobacterium wasabiae CFBP 3304]|nr:Hypothetical protein Y17_0079 [Pectobacterium wasabiae CFBP 3304]
MNWYYDHVEIGYGGIASINRAVILVAASKLLPEYDK